MKKYIFALFIALVLSSVFFSGVFAKAQTTQRPTRASLEEKKKQLAELNASLAQKKKKAEELQAQLDSLSKDLEGDEKRAQQLEGEVSYEEEEVAFLESPTSTVYEVTGSKTFLIDFRGTRRFVMLHGIDIDDSIDNQVFKSFKKQYTKKALYVRCANDSCSQVYLYPSKGGSSLNAELVKNGFATATNEGKYDLAAFVPKSAPETSSGNPTYSGSSSASGTSSSAGKDVQVRGYYRKDGTYVRPHTRSAPGTKKKN